MHETAKCIMYVHFVGKLALFGLNTLLNFNRLRMRTSEMREEIFTLATDCCWTGACLASRRAMPPRSTLHETSLLLILNGKNSFISH